ncbi:hypothetical protein M885DRAFT_521110 [Pelagophyceae sp. CCMP2097]|nr:hypothetical protein M885DRAFT_521110 [Pelagophyceae sp. CCMP2097]|mmetsp:Transcript_30926/g.106342  ORF Transcript_30926/g.106342 Transcript_30926/m.106342 type:complete len:363 (-) Transcript_30926:22-1110(-)
MDSRPCIIVEFGSAWVRVGFAGEEAPRRTVSSPCRLVGGRRGGGEVTREAWFKVVAPLFADLLTTALFVREKRRVVLVDAPTAPRHLRSAVVDAVLNQFGSAIVFAPCVTPAHAVGFRDAAVLLDVGHHETRCVAVRDGRVLMHSLCVTARGGASVATALGEILGDHRLTNLELEDAAARACSVRRRGAGSSEAADGLLDETGGLVLDGDWSCGTPLKIPHAARFQAAEALFDRIDDGPATLADLVMGCLSKCAVDVRRALAVRIVPCGGGAMITGFNARLLGDLRDAGAPWDLKIPKVAFARSELGWVGASLLATAQPSDLLPGASAEDLAQDGVPDIFSVATRPADLPVLHTGARPAPHK